MRINVGFMYDTARPSQVTDGPADLDLYLDEIQRTSLDLGKAIFGLHFKEEAAPRRAAGLQVTVNGDHGSLLYSEPKREGEPRATWESKGDKEFALTVHWSSDGHWAEISAERDVPFDLVRKAVHEFARTGERPTCVEWRAYDPTIGDSA